MRTLSGGYRHVNLTLFATVHPVLFILIVMTRAKQPTVFALPFDEKAKLVAISVTILPV
jgi:hypothetical protein